VPSKILESCVFDTVISHVYRVNESLVTDNQWAYRKEYSTVLLLIHLTETWRLVLNANCVVTVTFVDFQKAFDSVSLNPDHKVTVLVWDLRKFIGMEAGLFNR